MGIGQPLEQVVLLRIFIKGEHSVATNPPNGYPFSRLGAGWMQQA